MTRYYFVSYWVYNKITGELKITGTTTIICTPQESVEDFLAIIYSHIDLKYTHLDYDYNVIINSINDITSAVKD